MARDFDRIQGNVQKLIDLNAPTKDIDAYLAEEGLSAAQFKAKVLKPKPDPLPEDSVENLLPEGMPAEGKSFIANAKGALDASVDSINNMITMGWSDELQAATRPIINSGPAILKTANAALDTASEAVYDAFTDRKMTWNDTSKRFTKRVGNAWDDTATLYNERIGKIRAEQAERAERHPVASTAGSVAGFLGSLGGAAEGNLGRALNLTPGRQATRTVTENTGRAGRSLEEINLPSNWVERNVNNIGRGAVAGAVGGAGGGEGLESSVNGLLEGAAVGAGLGAVIPGVARLTGDSIGALRNTLGLADQQRIAEQYLIKKMEQDGFDPAAARAEVRRLQADSLNGPATLLDVGPQTQRAGRLVEATPGAGSSTLTNFLHDRQAGQGSRIMAGAEQRLGTSDAAGTIAELEAQRAAAASPLYQEAFEKDFNWSPALDNFLEDPIMKQAVNRGLRIQRLESAAKGEKFEPLDYGVTNFNQAGDPIISGKPNMKLLDAAKKGLDDVLEVYRDKTSGRLMLDGEGRAIDGFRRAYVKELDKLNPTYGKAREAWAGPSRSKDAVLAGRDFLRGDFEDMAIRLTDLKPGDLPFFKVGISREIRSMIERTKDGYDKVAKLFGNPDIRNRMEKVLGPAEFKIFKAQMEAEARMFQSRRVATGNSVTKRMDADMAEAAGNSTSLLGDTAGALVRGDTGGILRSVNNYIANKTSGVSEEAGKEMARMLTQSDPVEVLRVVRNLQRRQHKTALTGEAANSLVNGILRTTAGTAAQPLGLLD